MKIISPTGVLSNAVHSVTDLMAAQIRLRECMGQKTRRAVFHVGTQINGVPHIGTFVTHASAFKLAQIMRRHFNGLSAEVEFVALDNASHDTKTGQNGAVYQRAYAQMDEDGFVDNQIRQNYSPFFADLQRVTGTPYRIIRYSEQQSTPAFRKVFLDSLGHIQELGHVLAPATASLGIRLPSNKDGYAEKKSKHTRIIQTGDHFARFLCQGLDGTDYDATVTPDNGADQFLDLNTLYRNVVKESVLATPSDTLHVMIKGGDWSLATSLVDQGLNVLGVNSVCRPMRVFTPLITTVDGAKLSKTLLKENPAKMEGVPMRLLDMSRLKSEFTDYAECVCRFVDEITANPSDFFRAYNVSVIDQYIRDFRVGGPS